MNTMLDAAIEAIDRSNSRPVVHSDRGVRYRWPDRLTGMREATSSNLGRRTTWPTLGASSRSVKIAPLLTGDENVLVRLRSARIPRRRCAHRALQ
ncbi:hypothetical protein CFB40_33140 [Burkholderia sp. AU31652]|nr:hypothetical protein CFB40_33140 [Burkholderia sp. AU31652]OXJ07400.1 hypothetical protein CFB45_35030 [Burkholderia sp. HI2500]